MHYANWSDSTVQLSVILRTIGIREQKTQALLNGGLMIWSWLVFLVAAFYVDKLGRRFLFLFAGIGMLLAFSVWTACSAMYAQNESKAAGGTVVAMIFVFYGAAGATWPGLTVSYTVEILHTISEQRGSCYASSGRRLLACSTNG